MDGLCGAAFPRASEEADLGLEAPPLSKDVLRDARDLKEQMKEISIHNY